MIVVLIKSIEFSYGNTVRSIPEGTEIYVDCDHDVGYFEGEHFEIFPDEYRQLH